MWPKITFRRLERLSLRPPTTPTTKPPPPRERRNIGRMGIIISLLKSLRKLVKPRSSTFLLFVGVGSPHQMVVRGLQKDYILRILL